MLSNCLCVSVLVFALVAQGPAQTNSSQNGPTDSSELGLLVLGGEIPLYPQLAVASRMEGTVVIQVAVVKGIVTKAETPSTAKTLLATAAKRNVMSWRFAPDVTRTLNVTYVFEISDEEVQHSQNPEIEMKLPTWVKIVVKPVKPVTVRSKGD